MRKNTRLVYFSQIQKYNVLLLKLLFFLPSPPNHESTGKLHILPVYKTPRRSRQIGVYIAKVVQRDAAAN